MSLKRPLFVRKGTEFRQVKAESVAFLRAEDNYARMYLTSGRNFIVYSSLQRLEHDFQAAQSGVPFVRIHRSYLVNAAAIDKWNADTYELHVGEYVLPLSRQKRKALEAVLILLG